MKRAWASKGVKTLDCVVSKVVRVERDKGQDDEGSVGNAHGQRYLIRGNNSRLQEAAILCQEAWTCKSMPTKVPVGAFPTNTETRIPCPIRWQYVIHSSSSESPSLQTLNYCYQID